MSERPAPLRYYEITAQVLPHLFRDGSITHVTDGVPAGAELRNYGYDPQAEVFYVTLEHESFDTVPEGEPIPTETVEVEDIGHELRDMASSWVEYGGPADEACADELREVVGSES